MDYQRVLTGKEKPLPIYKAWWPASTIRWRSLTCLNRSTGRQWDLTTIHSTGSVSH